MPLPRSRLTKLFNVGRYLLNGLFHVGRKTKQKDVSSCRFEHLGGRDRLQVQVLLKHPVGDTAPRGPILSSAESLDEPSPLAAAPYFINISALDPPSQTNTDSTSEQAPPLKSPMPQARRSKVQSIAPLTSLMQNVMENAPLSASASSFE